MVKRIGEDDDDVQEGDSEFIKFDFIWDEQAEDGTQRAQATFDRVNDEPSEENESNAKSLFGSTKIQFIDTDYHTYAVGSTCQELEGNHKEDFFMWTREKQPSMYMRRRARNALIALGREPESMEKGPLVDCWGRDILM